MKHTRSGMSVQVVKDEGDSHYGSRITPSIANRTAHLSCSRKEPNERYRRTQERHSTHQLYCARKPETAYKKVLNEVLNVSWALVTRVRQLTSLRSDCVTRSTLSGGGAV